MAAITYGKTCYSSSGTVDSVAGDRTWGFVRFVVASLKAMSTAPWVTRGSSCNGSSGTAFSATPDGVDRWAGKSVGQASTGGAQTIWHVLENTVSGLQLIVSYAGATSSLGMQFVFSMNKFESAGVWRAGGTSTSLRPTDTASTPAAGREIASVITAAIVTGSLGPQIYRYNVVNRDDGKGAYWYYFPDSLGSAVTLSMAGGFFPFTNPQTETNPYMLYNGNYGSLSSNNGVLVHESPSTTTAFMQGRKGTAGTLLNYAILKLASDPGSPQLAGTSANDLDPVEAAYPLFPNIAWADLPTNQAHFRCGIPDFYQCNNSSFPDFNTWNTRSYITLGFGVFPYDPAQPTPRGSDRPGFLFSVDGDLQEDVTFTPDHRPFNSGLEVI